MPNIHHISRIPILVALAAMLMAGFVNGQDEKEKSEPRFVFVLTLNDQQINSLRTNGYLKSKVPKKLVNRISAIKIQRQTCFLKEAESVKSNTARNGSAIALTVDESVIDRLEYQPVVMKVYSSGFSTVLLRHNWNRKMIDQTPVKEVEPSDKDSKQLMIRIQPDRAVLGYLKGAKQLPVSTDFGDIKIDTDKILGIKFNVGADNKEIVSLTSGDTFSAQVNADEFIVKTRWGEKKLKVSQLDSVTAAINLIFVPDKKAPGQWKVQMKQLGKQLGPPTPQR